MSRDESPVAAVERVLRHQKIEPNNILVMMLIDAVRETTPAPREMTIGLLHKLLAGLEPNEMIGAWASKCAREITSILAQNFKADHEHAWCSLEGILTAMLLRVSRGQDLTS